jgi:hypothetical protein
MSEVTTEDSRQGQMVAEKQEKKRERKENLKVSLVETKLNGDGDRVLPLPE